MVPAWFKITVRLTSIVAVVSIASVVGLIMFRNLVELEPLHSASDALGTYLQVVGGIYAVLLAFVVVVVWGQFNDARSHVNREANALLDLHRLASGLPDEARDVFQQGLRDYLDAVLAEEWHAMTKNDHVTLERIGQRLDRVWGAIHQCMPLNECQHTVYAEVLARFNALSELRTNRLTAASAKIPIAMNVLLYTGALIMVCSIWLMPIEKFWLHATVTAALAGATAHILFLIYDLDDAFAGDYQVEKGPFLRARAHLNRR